MNGLFDICWMAVEPQYASDVQAHLQELRARDRAGVDSMSEASGDAGQGSGRRKADGGEVWADTDYDAFMSAANESYRRIRAFSDVLAASPDEQFTLTEACTTGGMTPTQLRAALGKFTTWIRATFDHDRWPFGWAVEVNPDNPTEFHYSMTQAQAVAWRAARERRPLSE